MNIDLTWDNPTPHPSCGYKASYRRKGDAAYSVITTSGATSGTTSLHITSSLPASYEGFVQSDCCSDNLAIGDPWGTNAYGLIVASSPTIVLTEFKITVTSPYPNPYDTLLAGHVTSNQQGVINWTATYVAGSTNNQIVLTGGTPTGSNAEILSNLMVTSLAPIFNNGGQLQQFDPVKTPPYFEFIQSSGQTSGTTFWEGSPLVLPSFTLDTFTVTETDVSNNPIAGTITMSWIQGVLFGGGVYPYNSMSFGVTEFLGISTIGQATVVIDSKGLVTASVSFVKGILPIDTSTTYSMQVLWADGSTVGNGSTSTFHLPDF